MLFIVSKSAYDYGGEDIGKMFSIRAPSLKVVIEDEKLFGKGTTIDDANEANGDGMPYIQVFDVANDRSATEY